MIGIAYFDILVAFQSKRLRRSKVIFTLSERDFSAQKSHLNACNDLKEFFELDALTKNKFKYSKSRCFLISPIRMSIIAESRMFVKRLISCMSFSI